MIGDADHKQCTLCGETKPRCEFHPRRNGTSVHSWCKVCWRIKARERNQKPKTEQQKRDRLRKQAAYRAANHDRIKASHAKWCKAHPDKVKKYAADARANMTDIQLDQRRMHTRKWFRKNKEYQRIRQNKRRANDDGRSYTAEDIARIRKAQRNRCAACRKKLDQFHIDHIKAISRGGSNHPRNIQLLCPPCNIRKKDKDPIDFMQSMGALL